MGAFRQRVKSVLLDIAGESLDFAAFRQSVEAFLQTKDDLASKEWEAARAAVRSGALQLDGLARVTAPGDLAFQVVKLSLEPQANVLDGDTPSLAA